jgi:large subunit ribosomal protein L18
MKKIKNPKIAKRTRRHGKIRSRVFGTAKLPRLSVFRSNKFIYAQLIDDEKQVTLVSASDFGLKGKTKTDRATEAGSNLAKIANEKKIKNIVFDRGGFIYAGRVKALAEAVRAGGIKF